MPRNIENTCFKCGKFEPIWLFHETFDTASYVGNLLCSECLAKVNPNRALALDMERVRERYSELFLEIERGLRLHGRFSSAMEAYAVIREELEESFDALRENDVKHAATEFLQVAATAFRAYVETTDRQRVLEVVAKRRAEKKP